MRIISFFIIFGMASVANASFFSKAKAPTDAEGNCLPAVMAENARLYGEIEVLNKIGARSEAQAKSPLKESQKLGLAGFNELSAKTKSTRAAIKKFSTSYNDKGCKAMVKQKVATFVVKDLAATLDKLAVEYEKMADDYLKPVAKK